ncbi:predicted protein [Histoplasma mississippiense (nom. inval.)]|uniref:predicted protein n=1 Tax=Ajellomyces capsulatus (strain NAm1 / WU24) TaxID=2059318 RepID=UPI000157BF9C|nr:predicted protein [Histoplasma mississippiense (nom. inval.)]EDN06511.1 predicted protein [Histoplasma mississippiense (nom. inval.)]
MADNVEMADPRNEGPTRRLQLLKEKAKKAVVVLVIHIYNGNYYDYHYYHHQVANPNNLSKSCCPHGFEETCFGKQTKTTVENEISGQTSSQPFYEQSVYVCRHTPKREERVRNIG